MKDSSYLQAVRKQYEDYPYPARNPEDERQRLLSSRSSALDCVNHYCFEGKQDFQGARVLIAGGGTGDCTLFLAEQLKDSNAEVTYLDMSTASMEIAKARAAIRNLNHINWLHESIYNLADLGLGKFDYISCTGVLHHLDDPVRGLKALNDVLKEDGAINVMVYGTYGRVPIYQIQDLMRRVNGNSEDIEQDITNTKKMLGSLPATNWFKFNHTLFKGDLETDIGLYDLLLHTQDRSYTVPEFYEFAESAGLQIQSLYEGDHPMGQLLLEPQTYIRDPELLKQIMSKPIPEQQAICELMYGQCLKQNGYFTKSKKPIPSCEDETLIPSISVSYSREAAKSHLKTVFSSSGNAIKINDFMGINRTPYTAALFNAINGTDNIQTILDKVASESGGDLTILRKEFSQLFTMLSKASIAFLRASNVPAFKSIPEMES